MPEHGMLEAFLAGAPRRRRRCSRCGPTTAPCCWPSTALSPVPQRRGQRRAAAGGGGRGPRGASTSGRSSSSRTWRRGGRPTGRSAPSRNAPATAWRRCCAAPRAGLPRVNRLTDLYNAVSVLHQLPLGGEDLSRYGGAATADPRHRRRAVRHHRRRRRGGRAPRARRGGVVRRRRRDLPALELAPGTPHPAAANAPPQRCSSSTRSTR